MSFTSIGLQKSLILLVFATYWLAGSLLTSWAAAGLIIAIGLIIWRYEATAYCSLFTLHAWFVIDSPLAMANHHFVLMFLALSLAICPLSRAHQKRRQSIRLMWIILMTLAAVHKILCFDFSNGSFLAYMFLYGGFGADFLHLFPSFYEQTIHNQQLLAAHSYPGDNTVIQFQGPSMPYWFTVVAWLIIGLELGLAYLAWKAPNSPLFWGVAAGFLISLVLIRPELIFAATLALMLFLHNPDQRKNWIFALLCCLYCSMVWLDGWL